MEISDFPICFLIENYFHEVLLPWKNLECRRMLKRVICFWKQWACTWAEIRLLVSKSLFQLKSWNNWVIRDSSLHFPSFLGDPSPAWAAEGSSGAGSGAAWLGWAMGNSQNSPQPWDSLRRDCKTALHSLQGLASRGERALKIDPLTEKLPPNSNHLWVKITSNTWKLYSDKMNFWQSFHSYFKGEKCEAKGKSESFWNSFNGTLWRESLSDLTIST